MQTPKARNGSVEVPQRMSPTSQTSQKSSPSTNRTSRQVKVARFDSSSVASPNASNRTPKNRSPKLLDRGSPRTPMTEKKHVSKLSDLESQLAQLEDELKKTKDQLNSSETMKRNALQEGEEMRKQLGIMSARLKESHQQLDEFSTSEDARVQELRKLSQERDRVWQSEVEAIQKQHSMDSVALSSALNEIQKLKMEATHSRHAETAQAEIEGLKVELSETVAVVDNLRQQVSDCKRAEVNALQVARETQIQLEESTAIAKSLRSEGLKAKEAYDNLASELVKSKEKTSSLENLVMELEEKLRTRSEEQNEGGEKQESTETMVIKAELDALKLEAGQLKSALDASELRYQEEYLQSTLQIRNAFAEVERVKLETGTKEAELEAELKKARATIDMLKSESNESAMLNENLNNLKVVLLEKDIQIQSIIEDNELLKAEIQKKESVTSAETSLMKPEYVTEEAEMNSRKSDRVLEQLDAAQKAYTELEAELKKLKVQSDQWRKAAEAAAAMLSTGSNAKFVDRTVSFNSIAAKMESPLSDDDSPKKKNGNVLKKFGVLWKKGPK
ncbi:interactor of constitutive active ROPs 2, chloroplastic-like isoform X2 [Silene latifolia]|uniref:interactor of constitutive active ROPs 2, chloroplastic-like isoform X2 n=1 Tax=Silene latifolia TaxID=37657 RepID=UPI003D77ACEF